MADVALVVIKRRLPPVRQLNERSKNCPSGCRMRTPALTRCVCQRWKLSKGETHNQPSADRGRQQGRSYNCSCWMVVSEDSDSGRLALRTCLARRRQVSLVPNCLVRTERRPDIPYVCHMCPHGDDNIIIFESSHKTSVIHHLLVHTRRGLLGTTKTCSASDEDLSTPASFLFFSLEALGIEPRTTRPTVRLSCFLVCACLQRGSSCPSVTHSAIHAAR
jgi:hypothetical protein